LVFSIHSNELFGDAVYKINMNRQQNLRRPQQLPKEDDIKKLKVYSVQRIATILQDPFRVWEPHIFAELRDLTVSRLTLFNARRGGEPSRLLLSEWHDAEAGSWFDQQRIQNQLDSVDSSLFHEMMLTYMSGKGNHLVPVIIPTDCILAMKALADPEIRSMASVSKNNVFIFPCTQESSNHVDGWYASHRVGVDAEVDDPQKITANKFRHRVSTLYAMLDVSEADRELFYAHMGHSAKINANIYQAPLAESELLRVGNHLMAMDGQDIRPTISKSSKTSEKNSFSSQINKQSSAVTLQIPFDEQPSTSTTNLQSTDLELSDSHNIAYLPERKGRLLIQIF
jgi:hypothetical protein